MVSIRERGNIGAGRCQERRHAHRKLKILNSKFQILLCCSFGSIPNAFPMPATPVVPAPGLTRSKVVIVQDPEATDAFKPRPERIRLMVSRAITNLTGKAT